MDAVFEENYFNWLCTKAVDPQHHEYHGLLTILHRTEFVWVHPMDSNRAEDGIELRTDFLRETGFSAESEWMEQPASMLEVLLAFANRAQFQTDMPVRNWFIRFLANLELEHYHRVSASDIPEIEEILYRFIWRTYRPDGYGGLFPIQSTTRDQRKVELWYQFFEYVEDQHLV